MGNSIDYDKIVDTIHAYLATEKTIQDAGKVRPKAYPERLRELVNNDPRALDYIKYIAEHELVGLETGVYKYEPVNHEKFWDFIKDQIRYRVDNNIMPYSTEGIKYREQKEKELSVQKNPTEIKMH